MKVEGRPLSRVKGECRIAQLRFQHSVRIEDPPIARLLFSDTRLAWFWLIIRVYAGYEWLMAGVEKLGNPGTLFPQRARQPDHQEIAM